MSESLISVIDIAREHGRHKATVFKILRRLGIETIKARGEDSRGQAVAYLTADDYQRLLPELAAPIRNTDSGPETASGVFYLIQLEPEHDPGRFKVGFASNIDERLRSHRTAAPLSRLVGTWPCRVLWEKTAIDCVTADCRRLGVEVFRAQSIAEVSERCDQFFEMMPSIRE